MQTSIKKDSLSVALVHAKLCIGHSTGMEKGMSHICLVDTHDTHFRSFREPCPTEHVSANCAVQVLSPGAIEKMRPPCGHQNVKTTTSPAPPTSAWRLFWESPCRSGGGSFRACPTTASPLTMPSLSARPAAGLCSLTHRFVHAQHLHVGTHCGQQTGALLFYLICTAVFPSTASSFSAALRYLSCCKSGVDI